MNQNIKFIEENRFNHIKYNNHGQKTYYNENISTPIITFKALSDIPFIKHGFSTRLGGVSTGHLSSMNFSIKSGDTKENVLENYKRICNTMGIEYNHLVLSDQVHDIKIRKVTEADRGKGIISESDIQGIDGLITNVKDTPLVTFYADCVPLYFVDTVNKAIGLTHSGWRGTVRKIGFETVKAMGKEFHTDPKDIVAVIGPSICRDCYEVSEDVAMEFHKNFSEDVVENVLEKKENGKYQLDLWLVNKYIMLEAGILEENITISSLCTCCNSDILFSHRASHGKRGNLAAFLSL